jgi:hypothetical protein
MKHITIAIFLILVVFLSLDAVTAVSPHKISTIPSTTIYWANHRFRNSRIADTLVFAKARGFKTAGDSTAIFVSGMTAAGILTATVLNDSSIIITSDAAADSSKSFWYLIFRR